MSNPLAMLSDVELQANLSDAEAELAVAREAFAKAQDICHPAFMPDSSSR